MSPKKKKNKYMRYYNFLQFFILTKRIRKKKKDKVQIENANIKIIK